MTGVQTCALPISLRTLGLKRIGDMVVKDDTQVMRGLVRAVAHLVKVEEIN